MSAVAFLGFVVTMAVGGEDQPAPATDVQTPTIVLSLSAVGLAPDIVTDLRERLGEMVKALGAKLTPAEPLDRSTCQARPACVAAALRRTDALAMLWVSALRAGPTVQLDLRVVGSTGETVFAGSAVMTTQDLLDPVAVAKGVARALEALSLRLAASEAAPETSTATAGAPSTRVSPPVSERGVGIGPVSLALVGVSAACLGVGVGYGLKARGLYEAGTQAAQPKLKRSQRVANIGFAGAGLAFLSAALVWGFWDNHWLGTITSDSAGGAMAHVAVTF